MRYKEALDRTIENHSLYLLIRFECRDDVIQLWNGLRAKDIQRRVVECNSPVEWRAPFETDLSVFIVPLLLG